MLLPQSLKMPVDKATKNDFNAHSFWYFPWGKSVTHKGVDIFAKENTPIYAPVKGLVLYTGKNKRGGNVALIIGAKWRVHYLAHMKEVKTSALSWVNHQTLVGTVGSSGNAKGKSPHLHYAIVTLIPYPWRYDAESKQGWKKIFYLNPISFLRTSRD